MSRELVEIPESNNMADKAITPNSPINLKLASFISAIAGIVVLVWQAAAFKTEITSQIKFAVSAIQRMEETLTKNGTDVQQLARRITDLELTGSQPLRDAVQKVEKAQSEFTKRLDDIDRRMQIHILKTEPISYPPGAGNTKGNGDTW